MFLRRRGKHAAPRKFPLKTAGASASLCIVLSGLGALAYSAPQSEQLNNTADSTRNIVAASRSSVRPALSTDVVTVKDGVNEPKSFKVEPGVTVFDFLKKSGITVGAEDSVNMLMTDVLQGGENIVITRISTDLVTEQSTTPIETVYEDDPTLTAGSERVKQEGVEGKASVTYSVKTVNGTEESREELIKVVSQEAANKIVLRGTKPAPVQAAALAAVAPVGEIQSYAHDSVLSRGWSESDFAALVTLWNRESSWNPNAVNRSSGACGIPQALPCSKIPNPGDWKSQVDWGLNYIAGRYGSPTQALSHSNSVGWY